MDRRNFYIWHPNCELYNTEDACAREESRFESFLQQIGAAAVISTGAVSFLLLKRGLPEKDLVCFGCDVPARCGRLQSQLPLINRRTLCVS